MKKEYIKPIATTYYVNSNAIMLETSDREGNTGEGWNGGYSKDNGGSNMWEYMDNDD